MSVTERLALVRKTLAEIPGGERVTIVGAAKAQPFERIQEALQAGLRCLGCNYAQEGEALKNALQHFPLAHAIEWHFIGHVQSRKTRLLAQYDWVQSLERKEVAEALHARLSEKGRTLSCLIQVNIGAEQQKSGISPEDLPSLLQALRPLSSIKIRGLMAMPPPLEPVEDRRPFFRAMKDLFDRHQEHWQFDCLSMGTSEDFSIAVEEGATLIRLGTTLFGERSFA